MRRASREKQQVQHQAHSRCTSAQKSPLARSTGDAPHRPRVPAEASAPTCTIRGKRAPVSPRRAEHAPPTSHGQETVVSMPLQPGRGRESVPISSPAGCLPGGWGGGRKGDTGRRRRKVRDWECSRGPDLPRQRGASPPLWPSPVSQRPLPPSSTKGPAGTWRAACTS